MGWHRPYNISGTIHCDDRLEELCDLVSQVLGTPDVGFISHFNGAITICGQGSSALFISSGFGLHLFYAHVAGNRPRWAAFAITLEEALTFNNFAYSIRVHDNTINDATLAGT